MKNLDNKYCRQLNIEWAQRYIEIPPIIEKKQNIQAMKKELHALELQINEDTKVDKKWLIIYFKIKSF
jgi:Tfp pilus assembly protein PilN